MMTPRLIGFLALCSLAVFGCVRADVSDVGIDAAVDKPVDRAPPVDLATPPDGGADIVIRPDTGRDGIDMRGPDVGDVGDVRDGGGDVRGDVLPEVGPDAPAPTCSDNIKNSDETDVDCGGHCGRCLPHKTCLIGVDCIFQTCKIDHTCGECLVAADCPGVETECMHRTCTLGVCGTLREAAGLVLAKQTTGDCKSNQCAADGSQIVVNDDTDRPDDRNACTNDFCMAGVPSHTNLPVNSSCGGQNKCNASAQCVGCVVPADCAGLDTVCQTRTCSTAGVCGFNLKPAATRLTDPTVGDCKASECDGKGNIQVVNENLDLPVDNNPCTTDDCSLGTPAHRPVASATTCGTGLVCDGANHCVQCLTATTCAGTDTECHTRTCINGMCGISNKPAGTVTTAQTTKDCKRSQCDGLGAVTSVADTTDLPVDGNPCTSDVCTQSVPSNPSLPSGTSCGGTMVCDGLNACVACVTASTCTGTDTECHTRTCVNHACGISNKPVGTLLFSQTNGDCKKNQCDGNGNPQVVNDGNDLPVDGNLCTNDVCTGGTPTNPFVPSGTTCGAGLLCNATGGCVGCLTAANCPGVDTACQVRSCSAAGQCGVTNIAAGVVVPTQVAGDCKRDQCDGTGHVVTVIDDTDRRVDGNECTMDVCTMGVPSNPSQPRDFACTQNMGTRCNGLAGAEACVQCTDPSQCAGGPDTECHTRTCSAAGVCGISNTPAGTALTAQTAGDCQRAQCDGSGRIVNVADTSDVQFDTNMCTKDLCSGSAPSHPFEVARTPCSGGTGSLCDGMGNCVQCIVPADCPGGPDTLCAMRTCSAAGVCGMFFVPPGSAIGPQMTGDCKSMQCNGTGLLVSVADMTDLPVDTNPCTQDLCMGTMPSNPAVPPNTMCAVGVGTVCDGTSCVQCLSDANCDHSMDTACAHMGCTMKTCGLVSEPVNAPGNPPIMDPTRGDCQARACDGMNGIKSVVDNNDFLPSTNACIMTFCSMGMPMSMNLPATTTCTTGLTGLCDGMGMCL